jgi:hypothetical protein
MRYIFITTVFILFSIFTLTAQEVQIDNVVLSETQDNLKLVITGANPKIQKTIFVYQLPEKHKDCDLIAVAIANGTIKRKGGDADPLKVYEASRNKTTSRDVYAFTVQPANYLLVVRTIDENKVTKVEKKLLETQYYQWWLSEKKIRETDSIKKALLALPKIIKVKKPINLLVANVLLTAQEDHLYLKLSNLDWNLKRIVYLYRLPDNYSNINQIKDNIVNKRIKNIINTSGDSMPFTEIQINIALTSTFTLENYDYLLIVKITDENKVSKIEHGVLKIKTLHAKK